MLLAIFGCSGGSLSDAEKNAALWEMVHYAAKLAPGATQETKFESQHDEYYRSVVADYKWLQLEPKDDEQYYFLLSRPARSVTPMVEGIGGVFQYKNDTLASYEEIFRMWKMPEEDLAVRGKEMFDRMVAGKDLSMYYSKFSGDKYIEFPNENVHFDKDARVWKAN